MNNSRKPTPNPRIAVALLRVSTDDQKLGPVAQRAAIEAWARRESIEVCSFFLEQGVSGATPLERRTVLLEALEDLKARRAGVFVVAKRDRLARDVVCAALVERLVERAGARVCAADGSGEASGPEGALMRGIIDLFASYERLVIAGRTRAALAAKRARGERTGAVPFGFAVAGDGRTLVENPGEQEVIRLIRTLRSEGKTLRSIVGECERRGLASRSGQPIQKTQVERILRRAG